MFLFISRLIKGIILGWITSLILFLLRRALSKAFGTPPPYNQPNTPNTNGHDIVETLWAGMSAQHLQKTFGNPLKKTIIAGGEIWTYANLNGSGSRTDVTLSQGMVEKWQDITNILPS
jgi:hypothetical protein